MTGGAAGPRVLHVVPSVGDSFGGITTAVASLGQVEAVLGRRAALLAVDRPEQGATVRRELDRWYDVRLAPAGALTGRYHGGRKVLAELRHAVEECDLVVLHSLFDFLALTAARVAGRHGIPYVVWPHGCLDPYDLRKHRRAKRVLAPLWRTVLGGARSLVCTTRTEAERLHAFGAGDTPRRVVPLPLPMPERRGDPVAGRRRLGLPAEARVVLFLGRLDGKKNLPLLLDGFDRACRPGEVLVVAGVGDARFEQALRRRAGRLRNAAQVRFVGWVGGSDKADLFAAADLFALVSENENFGYAVAEALAEATPVLLSREVYLAEELEPRGAAVLCERTVPDVADGLRRLLDDRAARDRIGAAGRRFVAGSLDLRTVADRYGEVAGVGR